MSVAAMSSCRETDTPPLLPRAERVLAALTRRARHTPPTVKVDVQELADELGTSRWTVLRAVRELKTARLLTVRRTKGPAVYTLTDR